MILTALGALFTGITAAFSAYQAYKQTKNQESAINNSQTQFEKQIEQTDSQYAKQMEFADKQHADQMDFANRQLSDNTKIANDNIALQREAYEYQKQLNSTQMEREDKAIQRQIADYKAAGLSPLAAIGGNGAGSAVLSPGSAPQYDMSGINAAAGQYADFARQYATLKMAASQNYMNSKSQAAQANNASILGARMALAQMKSDMYYKGLNASTQIFNSAVNARHTKIQNDYLQEQYDYLNDKHNWEEVHGYRDSSIAAAIANFATKLADKYDLGEKTERLIDNAVTKVKEGAYKTTQEVVNKSIEVAETIGKTEKLAENEVKNLTLRIIVESLKYAQDHTVK